LAEELQNEKEPLKERINIMRKAFVLSSVAFALLLFARGNALAKFHNNNFDGRYVCSGSSDDDDEQSVMFLKPNGDGGFTDGKKILRSVDFENSTLISGCTSKAGTSMPCPCVYTLGGTSTYSVGSDGTAKATLTWVPDGGNDASCADASISAGLTELWLLALSPGGRIAHIASNNNGFETEPAVGTCYKGPSD
jgi:hypothetical protein